MFERYDWVVNAGSDSERIFRVLDSDFQPLSLTGYTARMQVRPYMSASKVADNLTTENGRIVIEDVGRVHVYLTHEATALYNFDDGVYDIEIVAGNGDVTRIVGGRMIVRKEVTRE